MTKEVADSVTDVSEQPDETPERAVLSTGIDALDGVLASDEVSGLLIGEGHFDELETPIILISGSTGTGKTTLALQIGITAASKGLPVVAAAGSQSREPAAPTPWLTCFYALEQTAQSLTAMARKFNWFNPAEALERTGQDPRVSERTDIPPRVKLVDLAAEGVGKDGLENPSEKTLYLCHLSPRPISEVASLDLFETRFAELRHMVEIVAKRAKEHPLLLFIDSLNAFASGPLTRNQIHRLFTLLRARHVTAVVTMEHHKNLREGEEFASLESAKFLSDVAITLSKDSERGYLQYYLEVEKSRVSLQRLGKHPYKIRTGKSAESIELDGRTGIVLYPSVHTVLSRAVERDSRPRKFDIAKGDAELQTIMLDEEISAPCCISIIGSPGTHKLALGMNLAMGHLAQCPQDQSDSPCSPGCMPTPPPNLLIVNFGGSGNFNFGGVAWTVTREGYARLAPDPHEDHDRRHAKFWRMCYEAKDGGRATVLTFRIGELTPEECVYIINRQLEKEVETRPCGFSSVLLSDTAELASGFPWLASDPLFLPALVDLFAAHGLVTVCIGVDTGRSTANAGINYAISARADYRIVTSHYPEQDKLFRTGDRGSIIRTPQSVYLVIDNVTGKHYERTPKWLMVRPRKKRPKRLQCSETPPRGKKPKGA